VNARLCYPLFQGLQAFQLLGALMAGGNVPFDLQRMRGVEFVVDETMQHQLPLGAGFWSGRAHFCPS
jgi:hypothetical protein